MENKDSKKKKGLIREIKDMRKTSRGKAIVSLIFYGIFLLCVIIFCAIAAMITDSRPQTEIKRPTTNQKTEDKMPEKNEEKQEENKREELPDILTSDILDKLKNDLVSKEYDYEYKITYNTNKYNFKGHKTTTADTGYKESPTGVIKYSIDATGTYMENTSGKTPITNLYDGFNKSYIDLNYVIEKLKAIELKRNREYDCICYIYEGVENTTKYQIEIDPLNNKNSLTSITIKLPSEEYILEFENGE